MLRQLAQDVDAAEEVELRRLERHPEACRAVAVLAAARAVADGEPVPNGLREPPCPMACARRRRGRWLVCAMRLQGHRPVCVPE